MARPKKDCKPFSIRMEQTVFDRLSWYCEQSGQTKTVAIERAVMRYIDEYEKQQSLIKANFPQV